MTAVLVRNAGSATDTLFLSRLSYPEGDSILILLLFKCMQRKWARTQPSLLDMPIRLTLLGRSSLLLIAE